MAPGDAAKPKSSSSTFFMIAAFLLVVFIMFDNNLRIATGAFVGSFMDPVASFWDGRMVWTLAFASVVMIVATTIIRHFLVDWVNMARVQEVMRSFQKEFRSAQKENNTYRVKRLTEQQPEIMKMQADMSTGQLKPMAFTMLIVIPIFAWLSTIALTPVAYGLMLEDASDPFLAIAVSDDLQGAAVIHGDADEFTLLHAADAFVYQLPGTSPTGTLTLDHPARGLVETIDVGSAQTIVWQDYRVGDLEPGSYRVKPDDQPRVRYTVEDETRETLSFVVVAVPRTGDADKAQGAFVNGNGGFLNLTLPSEIYAMIPVAIGREPTGGFNVTVRPADSDNPVASWAIDTNSHLLSTNPDTAGAAHAKIVPHQAVLPWNPASDLNGEWGFFPHWILFYSVFSIPLGQITQKALKLIEYRRVDLDGDGKVAGAGLE